MQHRGEGRPDPAQQPRDLVAVRGVARDDLGAGSGGGQVRGQRGGPGCGRTGPGGQHHPRRAAPGQPPGHVPADRTGPAGDQCRSARRPRLGVAGLRGPGQPPGQDPGGPDRHLVLAAPGQHRAQPLAARSSSIEAGRRAGGRSIRPPQRSGCSSAATRPRPQAIACTGRTGTSPGPAATAPHVSTHKGAVDPGVAERLDQQLRPGQPGRHSPDTPAAAPRPAPAATAPDPQTIPGGSRRPLGAGPPALPGQAHPGPIWRTVTCAPRDSSTRTYATGLPSRGYHQPRAGQGRAVRVGNRSPGDRGTASRRRSPGPVRAAASTAAARTRTSAGPPAARRPAPPPSPPATPCTCARASAVGQRAAGAGWPRPQTRARTRRRACLPRAAGPSGRQGAVRADLEEHRHVLGRQRGHGVGEPDRLPGLPRPVPGLRLR